MKICFLGWGDHVHLERWATWFAKEGHQVSVISVSGIGIYPTGTRTFSIDRLGQISTRVLRLGLKILIRVLRPDVIHVHWAHFADLLNGIWSGPLVITVWGSDVYLASPSDESFPKLSRALQRADLITADSADLCMRTTELSGVARSTCQEIQWGVDTELFSPSESQVPEHSQENEAVPIILSPRNFTPLYNLDILVEAFALAKEQNRNLGLIMKRYNQEADFSAQIEKMIVDKQLSDCVSIVERIDYEDMPRFYQSGSIVISIPDSDATPMSVLEAMACGCIPIVSDLPSLREWIEDGENGFLVNPKNVGEIAIAISRCLSDAAFRQSAIATNRELVESRASQRFHMGVVEQHYQRLTQR